MNTQTLDIGGLETVYDQLATAIDAVGAEKSELLLVKLALLNAQALGRADTVQRHIQAALQDL